MHADHWSDEDLIELALDERGRDAELELCWVCSDRLMEWRDFLQDVRVRAGSSRETDNSSLRALVERVLAETTRCDPDRRDDRRFLDRLQRARASRLWKRAVAAAGLVAGVAALGTIAWRFDSAPDLQSAGAALAGESVDQDDGRPDSAAAQLVSASLERTRSGLDVPDPEVAGAAPETIVGRILGSRGAWLRQRTPVEPRAIAGASSDPAARALLCEHVLDRYAIEDYVPANFDRGIQAMLDASTPNAAERRLELAALARARDYGLLDTAEESRLGEALAKANVDPAIDPLFQDGARTRAPIDPVWLGALEDTLEAAERCDPVVQEWLALR